MKLEDIAAVLACSKPAASLLKRGQYAHTDSDLSARYARLVAVVEASAGARLDLRGVCRDCPRQACEGCRVADLL